MAAADVDAFSRDQRLGDPAAGRGENPSVGLAGNAHQLGRRVLVHSLEIRQTNRLHFFHGKVQLPVGGDVGGPKTSRFRAFGYPSALFWSRHEVSFPL